MINITNTVSFGDLFTGLSVLVSAFGIVWSQTKDRQQRRREARVNVLQITLDSISTIFEQGLELGEKIMWKQAGVGEYTPKEIVDFGFGLKNKIRSVQPSYSVWASEKERVMLNELDSYVGLWNDAFATYLSSEKNIPSFDTLLDKIELFLNDTSKNIRATLQSKEGVLG